jgi:RNA polymerase sigma-70 factor (ECF subfamily)
MMDIMNELVERLKEGEEEAFALIYSRLESPLINHLYKMLGSTEKAEEIFQETMLTLIKKINHYNYRPDLKNSFKAWVFRIGTNLAIDEIRKKKEILFEVTPELEVSAECAIETSDTKNRINELIMLLPVIQRTFLNLKINEDLSHNEIAAICSCNINTVKQGLFRARKSLKDLLISEGIGI